MSIDFSAPTISGYYPGDEQSGIPTDTSISVEFNESVRRGTGSIILQTSSGQTIETFDANSDRVTIDGATLTINPTNDLEYETQYIVEFQIDAVRDLSGNPFAGSSNYNFTTDYFWITGSGVINGTTSSDHIRGSYGADEIYGLDGDDSIYGGKGDDVISGESGNDLIFGGKGNDVFKESIGDDIYFGDEGIDRLVILFPRSAYTVSYDYLKNQVLLNSEEMGLDRVAGVEVFQFLDVSLDLEPPRLGATSPADGGVQECDRDLYLYFSENVFAGVGTIKLYKADGTLVESFNVASRAGTAGGTLSFSYTTVILNPGADLIAGDEYYLLVDSTAVEDGSGQAYAGISGAGVLNFTALDSVPTLNSSSPADGGVQECDRDLYLYFSENVFAGVGTIKLYKADGTLVESFNVASRAGTAGGTLSFSYTTVILNPGADLIAGDEYYLLVDSTAVEDGSGQAYAGISGAGVLNFTALDSVPTLNSSSPADGGVQECDRDLYLYFSENVFAGVGTIKLYKADGTLVESFNVASRAGTAGGTLSFSYTTVILNPGADLIAGDEYYLLVDSTAVEDGSGQAYAGISGAGVLNFTALDSVPTLNSSSPADGGVQECDRDLYLYFSENVFAGVGTIKLYKADGTLVESFNVASRAGTAGGTLSFSYTTVILNPGADLIAGDEYYLLVDSTAVEDGSGQAYAGISGAGVLNFTALDSVPTLNSSSPADGGVQECDRDLYLYFSENVFAGVGTIKLYKADGTLVESFNVASRAGTAGGTLSFSYTTVILNPGADLIAGDEYYLLVDSTAVEDGSGQAYAGISGAGVLNFTALDSVPTLNSSSPADGGVQECDRDLYLYFSENVFAGVGTIKLYKADGTLVESFNVASRAGTAGGTLSFSYTTVILNPGADLIAGDEYYLLVDSTAVEDGSGQAYAGISGAGVLNFTALDSVPTLNSSSPADGGVQECDRDLYLYFSENVFAGVGTIKLYKADGTLVESFNVASRAGTAGGTLSFSYTTVILNPGADLIAGDEYYLLVDSTAVEDGSGQAYAGISGAGVLNFTALDSVPTLNSSSPADGGVQECDRDLYLYFSENVFAGVGTIKLYKADGTLVESFNVASRAGTAGGTLSFSYTTVILNPGADLIAGDEYYLLVDSTAVEDGSGQAYAGISGAGVLNFTALDSVPTLNSSSPADGGVQECDRDLYLYFSENVFAGVGTIKLYKADGTLVESFNVASRAGTAGGTLSFSYTTVILNPGADLIAGDEYYLLVDSTAVEDGSGQAYAGISGAGVLNFTAWKWINGIGDIAGTDNNDHIRGSEFDDQIYAFGGDDIIYGGAGEDILIGENGDDSLFGEDDDDRIYGGQGLDYLSGGAGRDYFVGGYGDDIVIGGTGADIAVFFGDLESYEISALYQGKNNSFSGYRVRDKSGSDGSDTISKDVEFLSFANNVTLKLNDEIISIYDNQEPIVSTFSPADEATSVAIGANIVVTFSESIQRGSGNIVLKTAAGSTIATYSQSSSNVTISGSTLTINPSADLSYSTSYVVEFASGSVQDSAGNNYAGTTSYNFTTASVPNNVPTSVNSVITVLEDVATKVLATSFKFTDADKGQTLQKVVITSLPTAGTLKLSGVAVQTNDEIAIADINAGNLTYMTASNGSGLAYATMGFKVHDGIAPSASSYNLTFNATAVNDAPTLANAIADQAATEGTAFSLSVANAFTDVDTGDVLILSATLADGKTKLPTWLQFNATTGAFTGTPKDADSSKTINVMVKATDKAKAVASETFALVIEGVNVSPTSAAVTVAATEDVTYKLPASSFAFKDGDSGQTLQKVVITSLPTAGTLKLSGVDVQTNDEIAIADISAGNLTYVTASNGSGLAYATMGFKVHDGIAPSASSYTMTLNATAVNDAPTLANAIADQAATEGTAFSLSVANAFTDVDTGDVLTLSATLADGKTKLPTWLKFTPATGAFAGTPMDADSSKTINVMVKATDKGKAVVSDTFALVITGVNVAPVAKAIAKAAAASENAAFTYAIPKGTFTDSDSGDLLTYSASGLPSGLSINTSTGTITGKLNFAGADTPQRVIALTATDRAGLSASTNLTLNVKDVPTIVGSKAADTLVGGAGADVITGGAGSDQLTGGAGADQFKFDQAPGAANLDTITDFVSGSDKLMLSVKIFKAIGTKAGAVTSAQFVQGAGLTTGQDATDRLVFNTSNSTLYYDADGSGTAQAGVAIAVLTGVTTLSASDMWLY